MVRAREFAEYAEASGRPARRHHWLRTARLNLVGWSALLGLCVVAGAGGMALSGAVGSTPLYGSAGAVLPFVAVVLVDRRRWARMPTSFGWGGSMDDVTHVVALLEARGVHAEAVADEIAHPWTEPERDHDIEPRVVSASLEYRNRDVVVVREVLRGQGILMPELR